MLKDFLTKLDSTDDIKRTMSSSMKPNIGKTEKIGGSYKDVLNGKCC